MPSESNNTGRPDRTTRSGLLSRLWPFRPRVGSSTDSSETVTMARANRLIIGLGNPGPDYEGTRHNAGFMVVDRIAELAGIPLKDEASASMIGEGRWRGRPIALARPMTFMNRSGQAFQALRRRYGLRPLDILIIYDDIALPLGSIRLRERGGAGGHNGIQNIIDHLNSTDFPRLRVGVGDSFSRGGQVRYVLEPFLEEERSEVEKAIETAAEAALCFVRDGMLTAMNRYNKRS